MDTTQIILTGILSIISGFSGLWFGNKKQKLDLQSQSYDNILKQIEVYEVIIENLRNEVGNLVKKIEEQQLVIKELEVLVGGLCNSKK